MKKLPITTPAYEALLEQYGHWQQVQGYNATTIAADTAYVREYLHWLEGQGVTDIRRIGVRHYKQHYRYLSERSKEKTGGALSVRSLYGHVMAIRKFITSVNLTTGRELPQMPIPREYKQDPVPQVLSREQIKALYQATEVHAGQQHSEALAWRDKALLTVYYACGLRRTEGYHLEVGDIDLDRQLVRVRKGKNRRERYVPLSVAGKKIMQRYVYDYRPQLQGAQKTESLLLTRRGTGMCLGSIYSRLNLLAQRTEQEALQSQPLGLHTLRHTIATHLMESGMDIRQIQQFLGHKSLESTQIYTHILTPK